MSYTPAHRAATRARILEAAGRLFREQGFERAKIDEIMAAAGLTRGGFYLHFDSKQDLFRACMAEELEFAARLREATEASAEHPAEGAAAAIRYYLTPGNRKKIARGCTIVSNAADLARGPRSARRAFSRGFDALVDEFETVAALEGESTREPEPAPSDRDRAMAALATCVGAVVLARALDGEARIDALMEASARAAIGMLDANGGEKEPAPARPGPSRSRASRRVRGQ